MATPRPPPLRGTDGGFTADSIAVRLPAILDSVLKHNPAYGPETVAALQARPPSGCRVPVASLRPPPSPFHYSALRDCAPPQALRDSVTRGAALADPLPGTAWSEYAGPACTAGLTWMTAPWCVSCGASDAGAVTHARLRPEAGFSWRTTSTSAF